MLPMITEGATATVVLAVSDVDTAIALRSGDVAVLGTPRVVALCEEAAVAVLAAFMSTDLTSVGTQIVLDHLAASSVGTTVVARATVTAAEGRKILFDVELTDGDKIAAKGTHTRVVVDRAGFEESATRHDE